MSNVPTDLRANPDARGPVGSELMGVSIALPLKEVTHEDGQPWSTQEWRDFIAHAQPQMLDRFRAYVGGARPATMPQLALDGPHSDPLQGVLYVMTVGAWVFPATLPPDCLAYRARSEESGRG